MQNAGSGSDSRTRIPVRRTPASAVDALRLGLRWLAHQPRDARTLYKMPGLAGSRTSGEQRGPTRETLKSEAWTPAGPANAAAGTDWKSAVYRKVQEEMKANRGLTIERMVEAGPGQPISLLPLRCG